MRLALTAALSMGLALGAVGCNQDRPHDVGRARPDVDALNPHDRGLQSKDVVAASEQMARDVLAAPEVRQSPTQLTIVGDRFEDLTRDRNWSINYDIFLARLKSNLGIYGKGQVTLIENKAKLNAMRSTERDDVPGTMTRLQPDYALHGKAYDLPNRGTNYYLLEFDLTDLRTGQITWINKYEVKVAR
ncbi:MAG: hypothetical protein ABSH20_00950 [Tepidisphaeraceae bacterium]